AATARRRTGLHPSEHWGVHDLRGADPLLGVSLAPLSAMMAGKERTMRIFLAALGLVIGSAGTAADDLVRFAPAFATQPTGLVFHYTAPLEGFAPDSPTLQPPMDNGLSSVLIGGTGVDPLSGLDLDKVEGVLTLGNPPNGVI